MMNKEIQYASHHRKLTPFSNQECSLESLQIALAQFSNVGRQMRNNSYLY